MRNEEEILVACEFSGIVRDAFIDRGYQAYSCDLRPSERPGPHIQGDVRDILKNGWAMMIACPPCTHLAVSGARYFKMKEKEQEQALDFVKALLNAPIRRIALENPIGIISTRIRKPDQIIQPWQFGHDASKATCLWLKNLPLLKSTREVPPRIIDGKRRWSNQTDSGQNRLTPGKERAYDRSRTYEGIAKAMAEQWGGLSMRSRGEGEGGREEGLSAMAGRGQGRGATD